MVLSACGSGDSDSDATPDGPTGPGPTITRPEPAGDPRAFALGLSNLPAELTSPAVLDAYATAATNADLVLIKRAPPWREFLPGGSPTLDTTERTRFETGIIEQYDPLQLFFAIDPTDPAVERMRIINLPGSVDPEEGFLDDRLRDAFVAYTTYIAANYQPAYLALGVEINMLYERNREQFDAFVTLYNEAYDAARAASPETKIFPTFQYEDLQGIYGDVHSPHWEVIEPFRGKMDLLALSTYPYLAFESTSSIPDDYYAQAREVWDGDILIAEVGYTSEPVEGHPSVGTEEDQLAYLDRLLADAQNGLFSGVFWYAALDPAFAREGTNAQFSAIGLKLSDGTPKQAWDSWTTAARRPRE